MPHEWRQKCMVETPAATQMEGYQTIFQDTVKRIRGN